MFVWDDIIKDVLGIAIKYIPDPQQKMNLELELAQLKAAQENAQLQAEVTEETAQADIDKVEAASSNLFVSGWRPAAGWCCVAGLSYQFLLRSILGWIMVNLVGWSMPPALETDTLMTLLFGMLGLGGFRMAEKIKGVAS